MKRFYHRERVAPCTHLGGDGNKTFQEMYPAVSGSVPRSSGRSPSPRSCDMSMALDT